MVKFHLLSSTYETDINPKLKCQQNAHITLVISVAVMDICTRLCLRYSFSPVLSKNAIEQHRSTKLYKSILDVKPFENGGNMNRLKLFGISELD